MKSPEVNDKAEPKDLGSALRFGDRVWRERRRGRQWGRTAGKEQYKGWDLRAAYFLKWDTA